MMNAETWLEGEATRGRRRSSHPCTRQLTSRCDLRGPDPRSFLGAKGPGQPVEQVPQQASRRANPAAARLLLLCLRWPSLRQAGRLLLYNEDT